MKKVQQNGISISEIFFVVIKKIKLLLLLVLITSTFFFIKANFFQQPIFISKAKILIPNEIKNNFDFENFSMLGSQLEYSNSLDLSKSRFLMDIIKSQTFKNRMLDNSYLLENINKSLQLSEILYNQKLDFNNMVKIEQFGEIATLYVYSFEPNLSKQIAEDVLLELEKLSNIYRLKNINDKKKFISNRINRIKSNLVESEKKLQSFLVQNIQIGSPDLSLRYDRLKREVQLQTETFSTLKRQLGLTKIESIRLDSPFQILDSPNRPLNKSNKNLTMSVFSGILFGMVLGLFSIMFSIYYKKLIIGSIRNI